MKKLFGMAVMALAVAVFPTVASAATNPSWTCDADYEAKLLAGGSASCVFYFETQGFTDPVTSFSGKLVLRDLEVVEFRNATGWSGSLDRSTGNITLAHAGASTRQAMFTIEFKLTSTASGEDCGNIHIDSPAFRTSTTSVPSTDVKNPEVPETGSALSYTLVGAGIALATGAVYVSMKKRKVYNI